MWTMTWISGLLTAVKNSTHQEQEASCQERNVDTWLKDLNMSIGSLIDLARI